MPSYNLKIRINLSHSPILLAGMEGNVGEINESANIWIWNAMTWITLIVILVIAGIVEGFVKIGWISKDKEGGLHLRKSKKETKEEVENEK